MAWCCIQNLRIHRGQGPIPRVDTVHSRQRFTLDDSVLLTKAMHTYLGSAEPHEEVAVEGLVNDARQMTWCRILDPPLHSGG
jgi:hypothetical protein